MNSSLKVRAGEGCRAPGTSQKRKAAHSRTFGTRSVQGEPSFAHADVLRPWTQTALRKLLPLLGERAGVRAGFLRSVHGKDRGEGSPVAAFWRLESPRAGDGKDL